ncbi:MAG: hypothetical protein WCO84_05590, partial [bacterium]
MATGSSGIPFFRKIENATFIGKVNVPTQLTGTTGTLAASVDFVNNSITAATIAGPTGATGLVGETGHTGADGYVGSDGQTGATGLVGPSGADGQTGATGLVGPTGFGSVDDEFVLNSLASSGLIAGGILSINATDPTKFDISAGIGLCITGTYENPIRTVVRWDTTTGITDPHLYDLDTVYIVIDSGHGNPGNGTPWFDLSPNGRMRFYSTDIDWSCKGKIAIGWADHVGRTVIESANTEPQVARSIGSQFDDF